MKHNYWVNFYTQQIAHNQGELQRLNDRNLAILHNGSLLAVFLGFFAALPFLAKAQITGMIVYGVGSTAPIVAYFLALVLLGLAFFVYFRKNIDY